MQKVYPFLSLLLLLFSCVSQVRYIGTAYEPTKKVDVYVTQGSIKQPHEVIGRGYVRSASSLTRPERIQSKSIEIAREKGADAVLITDVVIQPLPTLRVVNTGFTDSTNRGAIITGEQAAINGGYSIYFIRYTR